MPNELLLIIIGLATGSIAGLLGAGGGFGTVVLLLAAGTSAHRAIGTSPVFITVIGSWGTYLHFRKGAANPWLALALGIPSATTAVFGAQLADSLPDRTLIVSFGCVTLLVAIALMLRPVRREQVGPPPVSGAQDLPATASGTAKPATRTVVGALAGGAFIGILQGLYGVGGGFLLVPFMVLVLGVPERVAVGSSLFALVFGSVSSGIRHALLGNVAAGMLPWLIPGGLVGSFAGAALAHRISPVSLRRLFVGLMFASATYLLIKGI